MLQLPVKIPGLGIMRLNAFRLCWRTVYVCVVSAIVDLACPAPCRVGTSALHVLCRSSLTIAVPAQACCIMTRPI